MIPWWWLIIAGWIGYILGCFVTSMMAVRKISDMAETIAEQRKMRQEFEKEWNKWGHMR